MVPVRVLPYSTVHLKLNTAIRRHDTESEYKERNKDHDWLRITTPLIDCLGIHSQELLTLGLQHIGIVDYNKRPSRQL